MKYGRPLIAAMAAGLLALPATVNAQEEVEGINFGGAVRLNYAWRDYDTQNKDRGGDFEMELFRINVNGTIGDVMLDAEWRRYNGFQAIHHAWLGYQFDEDMHVEVGITQVPFGILPFASHSFWFSGAYYLGFEDDYDTGIKLVQKAGDWNFQYAFFKNPEYSNDSRADRYSFDLVTGGDQQNSETNQLNFRATRTMSHSEDSSTEFGLSLEAGQMYNRATQDNGDRWAVGAHVNGNYGKWNVQLTGIGYEYNPDNPAGVSDDFVQYGSFAFPFLAAAKGSIWSANVARSFDVDWGPVTGMTCYNDFSYIDADVDNSAESVQNVTGCMLVAGALYTYVDWIAGKNMWFAGGNGVGLESSAGEWNSRLNVNFGYYF